jgi:sterol desaturase/sphingolipid hydroxylase (fatty acid hydroxylase superfamily)
MAAAVETVAGIVMSVVIYLGFFLYDYVIVPIIGSTVAQRLPEKAKKHQLQTIDHLFINFNKIVSILFVYHCYLFATAAMNADFTDVDAMLADITRFPLTFPLTVIIYDFFYTIMHWALHIPAVYPLVHKHHHRQLVPFRGNIDAINVHPIEYVLGEYNHLFAIFLVTRLLAAAGSEMPMHAVSFLLYVAIAGALSSLNHTRLDINIPYLYSVWWHDYHHRQPRCNYGQYIMLWDSVFGWFKPRSVDERVESVIQKDD